MKRVMLCAVMLLLICSLSAHAAERREQTFVVGADVNAQGEVTQTQPEAGVNKSIAAALDLGAQALAICTCAEKRNSGARAYIHRNGAGGDT